MAMSASDYNALSGSVEIPAGSQTATINLVPIDDYLDEGSETVTLTLTSTDTSGVSVDSNPATVTISDEDGAGVVINPSGVSAVEGGSTSYLVRLNSQPEPGETVTVTITDNTAGETSSVTSSV